MAESIEKHGVLQPIRVRWRDDLRRWVIISGERRYRASMLAGLSAIPCIFVERESDDHVVRLEQLVENCRREDFPPMEQAEAFRQLTELTGWSTQQLANELNLSNASVVRSLALLPLLQRSLWSHRP